MLITEEMIYLDIETATEGSKPDSSVDIPRFIGFKDILTGKKVIYDIEKDRDEIQRVLDYYDYIAGHNIMFYDIPVLERWGFHFGYKVIVDTMDILRKRAKPMLYLDFSLEELALGRLCEYFDLEHKKGEFDYDILKKEILSSEEYEEMCEYLYDDLDSGTDLLVYLYELFYGLREFMSDEGKRKLHWLTSSSGSTVYKIICNLTGLPEVYSQSKKKSESFEGGFVSQPYVDVKRASKFENRGNDE